MAAAPLRSSRSATSPDHRHIVLVPGLQGMLREAARVPRLVRRLLGRGESRALDPATCHSSLLFDCDFPAAALSRHLDRPDDTLGSWMRADPVGVTPDLGAVWLHGQARLSSNSPAARDLAALFSEEGMRLDLVGSDRGYLALERVPDCRFAPPWQLAGESMDRVWPQGPEALYWRRLLNETQMILHQHRQLDSELPGSLWFWGAGELPVTAPVARVRRIRAVSPEPLGAAAWAGLDVVETAESEVDARPGALVEWQPDHAMTAEDNLERLAAYLALALRRLRFDRHLRELELACEQRVWRLSTLRAWRPW